MDLNQIYCFHPHHSSLSLGKISREEIAWIYIAALDSPNACDKTFEIWSALDEKQIAQVMVIAWEIWKACCAYIFSHTPVLPDKTIQHVRATTRDFSRYGSFQEPSSGGTGYVITKTGDLIQFAGEGCTRATSAFHVGCLSLLRAVQAVLARVRVQGKRDQDSSEVADIKDEPLDLMDGSVLHQRLANSTGHRA
ncbi:hypothetical protein FCM35_KLT21717 [Carex littledalei]|uniref:Uncharacterized protein n=1 Tax=Carex littledalei TaxID=544730 RepID=A0A833QGG7_9POAL|nr:hypothetical protein FCM35_KLT21717 [Carex littledalei]